MARDSSLAVRDAVIAFLAEQPTVVALVPADRLYPPQRPANPQRPWIGYGVSDSTPFGASCLDGAQVSVRIHNYTETSGEGAETIPGEDMAHAINQVLAAVLDGATLELDGLDYPATAHVTWTGSQVLQDGADADAFHGIASFSITVSS